MEGRVVENSMEGKEVEGRLFNDGLEGRVVKGVGGEGSRGW